MPRGSEWKEWKIIQTLSNHRNEITAISSKHVETSLWDVRFEFSEITCLSAELTEELWFVVLWSCHPYKQPLTSLATAWWRHTIHNNMSLSGRPNHTSYLLENFWDLPLFHLFVWDLVETSLMNHFVPLLKICFTDPFSLSFSSQLSEPLFPTTEQIISAATITRGSRVIRGCHAGLKIHGG